MKNIEDRLTEQHFAELVFRVQTLEKAVLAMVERLASIELHINVSDPAWRGKLWSASTSNEDNLD